MNENEQVATPLRRRKDHDTRNQVVGTPATVPIATGEIPNPVESLASTPAHDEIARRAYQLYEERGGTHGRDLEDWFQTERELRRRMRLDELETGGPYVAV